MTAKQSLKLYRLQRGTTRYETTFDMVVCARTAAQARKLAAAGDKDDEWLDPAKASCEQLRPTREPGVLVVASTGG